MKKKIIAIFCILNSFMAISADFPHDTVTDHVKTEHQECRDVCHTKYKKENKCKPKYKKECFDLDLPSSDPIETCIQKEDGKECHEEDVPDGEECKEECKTVEEWKTYERELSTYNVPGHIKREYDEAGKIGAKDRYDKDAKTIEGKFEKYNTGDSMETVNQRQFNECAKNISNGLYQASRETGLNYVERRQEGNKISYHIIDKYAEAKQKALINEEARKQLNDLADSGAMRQRYKKYDDLPNNAEYYRDNNRVVNPELKPIVKKPGESITEKELKSNRPIFTTKEKEEEHSSSSSDTDWHHFEEEHHVNKDDGYRYYTYYSVSFNSNGATQGYTPSKITKIKDSYVTIPYNEGELTKPDYKMVGWNTSPNGYGTTYNFGETTLLSRDITLYAKWEKVEKVKPSKPIEHKTYYQIKFINGDHVTITGDKFKTIEKGNAINYVPSIKVDNEFKFKCWLSSNGKTYTDDEVKELIPTSSINFLAIVEGGEKTQSVPKPQKVKEKYNITFTANEHSKLKGTSNLEIEEQTKINNVPEVIVDEGYIFKNWLGSDGNTYTTDAVKELIPTTDMSFLVVTELKPKEKI